METVNYILIYFILTGGFGYREPQRVDKIDMSCGLEGQIVGVQLDSLVNPSKVYWPDPSIPNMHCIVDISQRIIGLEQGEYHLATSLHQNEKGPYILHDPHTSVYFLRVNGTGVMPKKPGQIRIQKP